MLFRFLRGGSEAEVLKFQEDSLQDHSHSLTDHGHTHGYTDHHYKNHIGNGYFGPNSLTQHDALQGQSSQIGLDSSNLLYSVEFLKKNL